MTLSVKTRKRALTLGVLLCVLLAPGARAGEPASRWITDAHDSARESAVRLLGLLAQGDIAGAAGLSNAPERRYEVLRDYRNEVGEEAFKRLYARYFDRTNRLVAEAALGPRRLLIWDLGEAGNPLAGQFFIEVEGRYVLDDVPSAERAELQRLLEDYRKRASR